VAKKSDTVSVADLTATIKKNHGDGTASFGGKPVNAERIPTGIFELDFALNGGLPRGKISTIYGPNSSGKTVCSLLAIAQHQKLWPHLTCAFVDIEHGFDPDWATDLGVDTSKLVVFKPGFAEQAIDFVESLLYAEDCGLVVVDSIGAFIAAPTIEKSAEVANVGGVAKLVGLMCSKARAALIDAEKHNRYPTLVYVNQVRSKVAVMYGDPEMMPGGNQLYHENSIILRLYGKNVMDPKVSQTLPIAKETTFIIKKHKVPIISVSGKFTLAMIETHGLKPGQTDDFNTVIDLMKSFNLCGKADNGKG